jgi:hypothetical protein
LEDWNVTESPLVNEWQEKGVLVGMRKVLLRLLREKFREAPSPEIAQLIEQQDSEEMLTEWCGEVVRTDSYNDFLAVLRR